MGKTNINPKTLLDILIWRAEYQAQDLAYIFLQKGEIESSRLTYGELDLKSREVASYLQRWQGERALLLYPSGLEFIIAFFGCLYAGVIPVPVYPPQRNNNLNRLLSIAKDAEAKIGLTTTSILFSIKKKSDLELFQLKLIATDTIQADPRNFIYHPNSSENLAFLQYTSGTTGNPKGVKVSHGNIIHNQKIIHKACGLSKESIVVSWLPLFHDMGLINHVFHPLYLGCLSILMPPVSFIQKPIRWLKAITKYKANASGAPNFSYDLCTRKIGNEQLLDIDLSSWDLAYCGAEPIQVKTLEQFNQKFSKCNFKYTSFYPCYGIAESTLFVSGGLKDCQPTIKKINSEAVEQNLVVENDALSSCKSFVGLGDSHSDANILIVNPDSLTVCTEKQIGEIWLSGKSVAQGYWNRPLATKKTFQAYLNDTQQGPFLRTGDLGFIQEGELFVTGRLKDVIIIRGKNHYPQDIELTVENSHPALRTSCGAAFAVEVKSSERLVVVQEVERSCIRKLDSKEIFKNIRQAITANHGLRIYAMVLLKTSSIPKTSSGKVQRFACRTGFLDGSLNVISNWSESSLTKANYLHL